MLTIGEKIKKLNSLEMVYSPFENSYILHDFNYSIVELQCDTDEEFLRKMVKIEEEMSRRLALNGSKKLIRR